MAEARKREKLSFWMKIACKLPAEHVEKHVARPSRAECMKRYIARQREKGEYPW